MEAKTHSNFPKNFPESFFEQLIRDIPPPRWMKFFQDEPNVKRHVFEGFSVHISKLPRTFQQPQVRIRLRKLLRDQLEILEKVLLIWADEKLELIAFVEMFDQLFLLENMERFKDFLGPERFCAALSVLNYLQQGDLKEKIDEDFWRRKPDFETAELLIPMWTAWKSFIQDYPDAVEWLREILQELPPQLAQTERESTVTTEPAIKSEEKKRLKLERKLEKEQTERQHLHDQLIHCKQEAEALRTQVSDCQESFAKRLQDEIESHRKRWYSRYQSVDEKALQTLKEGRDQIDSILSRADRAFELQREADEKYGLVAEVRQKLLRLELYLREIEKIYGTSLVIHSEVAKAKQALEKEKKRLLQIPGIEKVLKNDLAQVASSDLAGQVRLLEAEAKNLPSLNRMQKLVKRLGALGVVGGLEPLQHEIRRKKQQIFELLYDQFRPPKMMALEGKDFKNLEEFVESNQSKKYDLYLDGYNILLRIHGEDSAKQGVNLSRLREHLIDAVEKKSHLFRRVFLIFDGLEESRQQSGNLQVIYANKTRGITADSMIIDALQKRRDRLNLLVTEDYGIIDAVESKIYATIGVYDFYMFVFDMSWLQVTSQ